MSDEVAGCWVVRTEVVLAEADGPEASRLLGDCDFVALERGREMELVSAIETDLAVAVDALNVVCEGIVDFRKVTGEHARAWTVA